MPTFLRFSFIEFQQDILLDISVEENIFRKQIFYFYGKLKLSQEGSVAERSKALV